MSGPSVQATISAVDQATAVLNQFARNVQHLSRNINAGAKEATAASAGYVAGVGRMASHTETAQSRISRSMAAIATSFGLTGLAVGSLLSKITSVAKELSDITSKMQAYGDVSRGVIEKMNVAMGSRPISGYTRPQDFARATYAAARANLNDEQSLAAAEEGVKFGDVIGLGAEEATERLLAYGHSKNFFKDAQGRTVSADQLSVAELRRQLKELRGQFIQLARVYAGSERKLLEIQSQVAPMGEASALPPEVQDAMMVMAAQKGMEATARKHLRGIIAKATPTQEAMALMFSAGLDPAKYMTINREAIEAENLIKGYEARFGTLNKRARRGVAESVDQFKRGEIDQSTYLRKQAEALQQTGVKSLEDAARASKAVIRQQAGFVQQYDLTAELRDARERGVMTAGYAKARFGIESGSTALAIVDRLDRTIEEVRAMRLKQSGVDVADQADVTRQASFGFQATAFWNNLTALIGRLFEPYEATITAALGKLNDWIEAINGASLEARKLAADLALAVGALAAFRTALFAKDFFSGTRGAPGAIAKEAAKDAALVGGRTGLGALGPLGWMAAAGWFAYDIADALSDGELSRSGSTTERIAKIRKKLERDDLLPHERVGYQVQLGQLEEYQKALDAETERQAIYNKVWGKAPTQAGGPNVWAGGVSGGVEGIGPNNIAQQVQVSGEAEVITNSRIEVGLKPEIIDIINKAQMGLSGDSKLGRSLSGSNGVDKATSATALPPI